MKKVLVWLIAVSAICIIVINSPISTQKFSKTSVPKKRTKEVYQTGADKQLSTWFLARAYPDPYYLNEKFQKAWVHAQAMKNPENPKNNSSQSRLTFGGWSSLNGPNVGRVLSIAIHPTTTSTIFIGSASGGIWKTTNSGTNWQYVPTNLPVLGVPSIVFHPTNPNILLAGTGEVYRTGNSNIGYNVWKARGTYGIGIIRSTDGGVTWTQIMNKNMADLFGVQMIKFDPTNADIVYACTTHGLFKSTDAGATWGASPVLNKIYVSDVVINSGNNNQIMAAVGNLVDSDKGIYRTTNGGSSWVKISSAAIPTSFNGFSRFAYRSGSTVYISMGRNDANENELMRSADFGVNWTSLANSHHCQFQYWFANAVDINPSRPDTLMMGGVSLYRYRASTQAKLNTVGSGTVHSDFHDIKYDPTNSAILYIACDGGMYKSTNANSATPTYTAINTGLNVSQFYSSFGVSATTANRYVGGLQDNGVWSYSGSTWTNEFGGDGGPCVVHPTDANIVYASNDARKLNKSTGGVTGSYPEVLSSWAFVGDDRTGFMTPVAISKSSPTTIYSASDNLHKSTNSGTSWTNNSGTISSNTNYIQARYKTGIAIAVSPTNVNKLFVSLSNFSQRTDDALNVVGTPSVMKSTNGGTSFTNITAGLPNRFVLDFAISPTNDDSVFVTMGGFRQAGESHIYVTGDGGATWTSMGAGLPDVPFNAIVFDPLNTNIIYAGSDLGVYVSSNRGGTWYDFNNGLTDVTQVFDLQISADNKLVAATHGKGAYRSDLFDISTLPVTLREFSGVHQNGMNKLQWITEQEFNVKHFELERSVDGGSYSKITTVEAKNVNNAVTYQYADPVNIRQSATYFYRLKIIDLDGSYKYSSVVALQVVSKNEFSVLSNPVKNNITTSVTLDERQNITFNLYDAGGKLVKKVNFAGERGTNTFVINDIHQLSKGIYILETIINKRRYTERLLKN